MILNSKNKHLPQRTCIACRQTNEKGAFTRLIISSCGAIEIDITGKKPGRGAYLCPKKGCWEVAIKKNRLEYALRTKLDNKNRQTLIEYSYIFPEGS